MKKLFLLSACLLKVSLFYAQINYKPVLDLLVDNKRKEANNLAFDLVQPNQLKVTRKANMSWDDISVSDYLEYKSFVEEILDSEQQVMGFK